MLLMKGRIHKLKGPKFHAILSFQLKTNSDLVRERANFKRLSATTFTEIKINGKFWR